MFIYPLGGYVSTLALLRDAYGVYGIVGRPARTWFTTVTLGSRLYWANRTYARGETV